MIRPDRIVALVSEAESTPDGLERRIEVGSYVEAEWDRAGFYDEGGRYEHAYAGDTAGYFDYAFEGPSKVIRRAVVTARLSAESNSVGAPHQVSDVTLFLNGVEIGTRTVPADDGNGAVTAWVIEDPDVLAKLKPEGSNQLRLAIKKDATHRNGLCVYGRALDPAARDRGAPLTIRFEATDDAVVRRESGEGRTHEN